MGAKTCTKLMYKSAYMAVSFSVRYFYPAYSYKNIYIYPNKGRRGGVPRKYSSGINGHSSREPDKHKLCALIYIRQSNVFTAGSINKPARRKASEIQRLLSGVWVILIYS